MSRLGLALSLSLAIAAPLAGDVLYVTSTGDAGAGTLRERIAAAAASGDEIQFQLALPATISLASQLVIDKSLTIAGPGADQLTLSGNGATRVISIQEEAGALTVVISGLTIADGRHAPIADNAVGAGIANQGADLTITGCAILDNVAQGGSDQELAYGASGGGLWSYRGTVVVRDSTIARNRAIGADNDAFGSGGYAYGGGIATYGVFENAAAMSLVNVTVTGNSAESGDGSFYGLPQGGGVFSEYTGLSVEHATIAGNATLFGAILEPPGVGAGGGREPESVFAPAGGIGSLFGDLDLSRSLVTGNTRDGVPDDLRLDLGTFTSAGYNIAGAVLGVTGGATDDFNNGTDPLLGPLAPNGGPTETMAIGTESPAFDTIPAAECTEPADQRGLARPQGEGCDIGAYEVFVPATLAEVPALDGAGLALLTLALAALALAALRRRTRA